MAHQKAIWLGDPTVYRARQRIDLDGLFAFWFLEAFLLV